MFYLKPLPFEENALEPYISTETFKYHYWKHYQTYLDTLNKLIAGSEFEAMSLEDVIKNSDWIIFNNSAQVWNHEFYFKNLSADWWWEPEWKLRELIERDFETFWNFRSVFNAAAKANFWSGWTWLVLTPEEKLEIVSTSNAQTVITTKNKPLLVVDVWEHAYYIDTRNDRAKYLDNFWSVLDWNKIEL